MKLKHCFRLGRQSPMTGCSPCLKKGLKPWLEKAAVLTFSGSAVILSYP